MNADATRLNSVEPQSGLGCIDTGPTGVRDSDGIAGGLVAVSLVAAVVESRV